MIKCTVPAVKLKYIKPLMSFPASVLISCGLAVLWPTPLTTPRAQAHKPHSEMSAALGGAGLAPARSESWHTLTFRTIDPLDERCVMVYGGLSWGGEDFLIQDCGRDGWEGVWRLKTGYISRMFFQEERRGWFVVGLGLMKIEPDGPGFLGTMVRDNPGEIINDVFFIDEKRGWICGDEGAIFHTADRGATWQRQQSNTSFSLKKIRFISPKEGWARGALYINHVYHSVVLVTKDGGATWSPLRPVEGVDFDEVFFTAPSRGCAIDRGDAIFCTGDGRAWRRVYGDTSRRKSDIYFLNEREGWVVGDALWRTRDGGETWERFTLPGDSRGFEQVVFVKGGLGWARTLTDVWRTNDGGQTWQKVSDAWRKHLQSDPTKSSYRRLPFNIETQKEQASRTVSAPR